MEPSPLHFFFRGTFIFSSVTFLLVLLCLLFRDPLHSLSSGSGFDLLRSVAPPDAVGHVKTPSNPTPQLPAAINDIYTVSEDVRLDRALKKAAMVDNTVIFTIVNAAWTKNGSMLEFLMESMRTGERTSRYLNHLMIVALDEEAYLRCQEVHHNCFALTTEGVDFSDHKNFMSEGYLKLVWRKVDFQRIVLEKGYDFIFSDTDILWFRDPLPRLLAEGDIQLSCDWYYRSTDGLPNVGFHYARSNNRTIGFYKLWHSTRLKRPRDKTQEVFDSIKNGPFVKQSGLKIRYLDNTYFGGICHPSEDLSKVCTMHVNCCIGLENKINDLKLIVDDMRRFLSRPPSVNGSRESNWTAPQLCLKKEKGWGNKLRHD